MKERLSQGLDRWHEQTATDLLCAAAYPAVRYVPFTAPQERVVGADWLWWWVGETGECFGMLVQAKNLYRVRSSWSIDFEYRNGEQMRSLFEAAHVLKVPAGYLLYCGNLHYRKGLQCEGAHGDLPCSDRERAGVTFLTALMVRYLLGRDWGRPSEAAVAAFHHSVPLEDLVDPDVAQHPIMDLNLRFLDLSLREFLVRPQTDVRRIARHIFADVSRTRLHQFAAAVADRVDAETSVFTEFPADMGHFGLPYFSHILRGLRPRLPQYIEAILDGRDISGVIPDNVVGVVVVSV
jgi:uncharacterized protein DUF6615